MTNKGFADLQANIKTPNDDGITEKPLKTSSAINKRVDINVLKSKLKHIENKEFKKNFYILSALVAGLAIMGIYFSL